MSAPTFQVQPNLPPNGTTTLPGTPPSYWPHGPAPAEHETAPEVLLLLVTGGDVVSESFVDNAKQNTHSAPTVFTSFASKHVAKTTTTCAPGCPHHSTTTTHTPTYIGVVLLHMPALACLPVRRASPQAKCTDNRQNHRHFLQSTGRTHTGVGATRRFRGAEGVAGHSSATQPGQDCVNRCCCYCCCWNWPW